MHTDLEENTRLSGAVPVTALKNPCSSVSHKIAGGVLTLTLGWILEFARDLGRFSLVFTSCVSGFALDLGAGSWYNGRMELGDRNLSSAANRKFSTDGV